MMSIQFFILLFIVLTYRLDAKNFHPGLYKADKHHITILNDDNYRKILFEEAGKSMYFVEFYAHWCGTCKRYAPIWIKLADEAKSWKNVVKFAAMNCGDSLNSPACTDLEIHMYPTIRLFPVRPQFNPPLHGAIDFDTDKKSIFLSQILDEVEKSNKPFWPNLKPFKSQNLNDIFPIGKRQKYAFLIIENDALIAKKTIMDFSDFLDTFVIRRTSWNENADLLKNLKIDNSSLPGLVVIENINDRIFYRLYNKNLFKKDSREELVSLIKEYIQTAPYINHQLLTTTKTPETITTQKSEKINKIVSKVSMQDLETGLHLMLRNEIPHSGTIKEEEFYALRRWIRTLAMYFPGRIEVRNYLTNLDRKLSSIKSSQITGDEWIQMTKQDQNSESYLPESTEWVHCKGSTPNYRGYPCSLWTLFHTLTVHQYKLRTDMSKSVDVRGIIESIRYFVRYFFRCSECSKNFKNETYDYLDHLNESQDAVLYLWKVHNSVNRRLAKDITEDPAFPKVQFPPKQLCPDCYDIDNQLVDNKVFEFLMSYYSSKDMIPINELDKRVANQNARSILNNFQASKGVRKTNLLSR